MKIKNKYGSYDKRQKKKMRLVNTYQFNYNYQIFLRIVWVSNELLYYIAYFDLHFYGEGGVPKQQYI